MNEDHVYPCEDCGGSGYPGRIRGDSSRPCRRCGGSGELTDRRSR